MAERNYLQTRVLPAREPFLTLCAEALTGGEVVAFPTETVYGLGADGMNPKAVARIFTAKDRPADNPLIYHIHTLDQWTPLVTEVSGEAALLAEAFWPGPLTIILPAAPCVPLIGRAGLPTVGVRMPDHPDALAFLALCGTPVAAPSANRSGRPSPTRAEDVLEDMRGRIPYILDGGPCRVGVESTVVSCAEDGVTVLRPGGVTVEELCSVVPRVTVHPAALSPALSSQPAASPGMKHRHYAPRARVFVAFGNPEEQARRISAAYDRQVGACGILATRENLPRYGGRRCLLWGSRGEPGSLAENLFTRLREADALGIGTIYAEAVEPAGLGLAVMNRLLRAADFQRLE